MLRAAARTQALVTIGLVPGTLALFQQVSLVSPLANALAIPVVTFAVVPLALAGIVLPLDTLCGRPRTRVFAALMIPLDGSRELAGRGLAAARAAGVGGGGRARSASLWLAAPRGVPGRALGCIALAAAVRRPAGAT